MVRLVTQSLKIVTIAVVTILVVLGAVRFFEYYRDRTLAADVGEVVSFTVEEDESIDSVAKRLHDAGLIRYEWAFTGAMRIESSDVVPGKYRLRKGMSSPDIIDVLTGNAESVASTSNQSSSNNDKDEEKDEDEPEVLTLTIREGWRTEEIAEELVNIGWDGSVDDFMSAVEEFSEDDFDFLESRENSVNPDSLEGFLFPDTYQVEPDEAAEDIIQKLLTRFDEVFTSDMRERAEQMNLSVYQILIFASFVEREAQLGPERPIIADVYLNRYVDGWEFEADPSVRYGIGKRDGEWWDAPEKSDLEDTENLYNTYQFTGLPPGPICNPGAASIQAILEPGGTGYYFFVAKDDDSGGHLFAVTKAEQDQNVAFLDGQADAPAPGSDPLAEGVVGGESAVAETEGEEVPIESSEG